MKKILYRYDGLSRPDIGLLNNHLYEATDERESTLFNPAQLEIKNKWVMWASFTRVELTENEFIATKRDLVISEII